MNAAKYTDCDGFLWVRRPDGTYQSSLWYTDGSYNVEPDAESLDLWYGPLTAEEEE